MIMQLIIVYLIVFILPITIIYKLTRNIRIKNERIRKIIFFKNGWVLFGIIIFLWLYISGLYSISIGYLLWDSGTNDISNRTGYLWMSVLFSGNIIFTLLFSNLSRKLKKEQEVEIFKEIERKEQEIKEAEYKSKQRFRELIQKDFERRQKELEKIKNTLGLYSKEYNIDNLTIQRMYKMLEAWQGESIDPFNSLYASIFRKQEFKSLYDLGLIRQDSHFPYLFTFEKIKDIPLILPNVEYVKDRNIILPEMNMLDNLSGGFEFEQYIAVLLEKNGYSKIEVLPMSGDYGVDILAEKSEVKYAFQCKYYSQPVGIAAVQEVSSGKTHYNAHIGVVVTNNYFTSNALQLAETNGVLMWDRDKILKMTIK